MKLEGTLTALVTPFKEDGSVDIEGLHQLIDRQIVAKVKGLVILGTTGEELTLQPKEHSLIIREAIRAACGKLSIIVGTGTASTLETIERTLKAKEAKADAAIIITPYGMRPTQEGLFLHYEAICRAVNFPIMLYNNPVRTCCNLDPETVERISSFPHIIGLKDCVNQVAEILHRIPDFSIYSGDDVNTISMIALGSKGLVSTIANLIPEKVVSLVNSCLSNDLPQARTHFYELLPLIKAALIETNPSPLKEALRMMGLPGGPVRPPLCKIKPESKKILERVLEEQTCLLTTRGKTG